MCGGGWLTVALPLESGPAVHGDAPGHLKEWWTAGVKSKRRGKSRDFPAPLLWPPVPCLVRAHIHRLVGGFPPRHLPDSMR